MAESAIPLQSYVILTKPAKLIAPKIAKKYPK